MNETTRTHRDLIIGALVLGALIVAGLWFLRSPSPESSEGGTANQMAALAERLEVLERSNNDLRARLANGQGTIGRQADASRSLVLEEQKQRQRRLLEDPAYAKQEQRKRLAGLEQEFSSEPVSIQWAPKATVQVEDALTTAAKNSGALGTQGQVDCRSTQCRIRLNISDDDYDGFITYLSVGMTGLLPKARIVTIPHGDGTQEVSIFASANKISPQRGGG